MEAVEDGSMVEEGQDVWVGSGTRVVIGYGFWKVQPTRIMRDDRLQVSQSAQGSLTLSF